MYWEKYLNVTYYLATFCCLRQNNAYDYTTLFECPGFKSFLNKFTGPYDV